MLKRFLKVFLIVYLEVTGFFFTFSLVWSLLNHDLNTVSLSAITVLSMLAEVLLLLWLRKE